MAQSVFSDLEIKSKGFLTNVSPEDSHMQSSVLLTADYNSDLYADALFDALNIPCPSYISRAVPKRKADYLAGRAISHAAMTTLGVQAQAITTAPSRAPVWPDGLTGSISHARGRCACLLSQNTSKSVGIDTEAIAQGKSLAAILSETLTEKDRVTITQGPLPPSVNATLAFSAKEALFKALYPQVGHYFGFTTAELTDPPADHRLVLTLTADLTPHLTKGQSFTCHFRITETHVLTWLNVPTP